MFPGDVPKLDDPLPRLINDGAAKKLIEAPAKPIKRSRGWRSSSSRGPACVAAGPELAVDAVVQIGSAYWLHVPLGKLRTDRYIPLHPQLKELLDEWIVRRPPTLREPWLFMEHGRRIGNDRVRKAILQVRGGGRARQGQPRTSCSHTLATQAVNRGMSLEAIAALLGHKSMRMTTVYARISDRTVADEYFKGSEQVEAPYDTPKQLPQDAEGTEMRKLRSEMLRRMLGNGYSPAPSG